MLTTFFVPLNSLTIVVNNTFLLIKLRVTAKKTSFSHYKKFPFTL